MWIVPAGLYDIFCLSLSAAVSGGVHDRVLLSCPRFGRRAPLCGFMLLGGGCCLSIVGLPRRQETAQLRMLLGLVGERATVAYGPDCLLVKCRTARKLITCHLVTRVLMSSCHVETYPFMFSFPVFDVLFL